MVTEKVARKNSRKLEIFVKLRKKSTVGRKDKITDDSPGDTNDNK